MIAPRRGRRHPYFTAYRVPYPRLRNLAAPSPRYEGQRYLGHDLAAI